jgi:hypothetical protein
MTSANPPNLTIGDLRAALALLDLSHPDLYVQLALGFLYEVWGLDPSARFYLATALLHQVGGDGAEGLFAFGGAWRRAFLVDNGLIPPPFTSREDHFPCQWRLQRWDLLRGRVAFGLSERKLRDEEIALLHRVLDPVAPHLHLHIDGLDVLEPSFREGLLLDYCRLNVLCYHFEGDLRSFNGVISGLKELQVVEDVKAVLRAGLPAREESWVWSEDWLKQYLACGRQDSACCSATFALGVLAEAALVARCWIKLGDVLNQ